MYRPRRSAVLVALACALGVLGGLGWLGAGASAAPRQEPTTTVPPTTVPPTTVPPTTSPPTTQPATTTTARATTTTRTATTARPTTTASGVVDETDDTEPVDDDETSTTLDATTSSVPLLVDGPPVDPNAVSTTSSSTTTTIEVAPASAEGRTSRQVAIAVASLLVLAAIFAVITVWYWVHTKPRVAPAGTR